MAEVVRVYKFDEIAVIDLFKYVIAKWVAKELGKGKLSVELDPDRKVIIVLRG